MARYIEKVTIAAGSDTSDVLDLEGSSIVAIIAPVGFEGTSITFTASEEKDGTFIQVTRGIDGNVVTGYVVANKHVLLLIDDFFGAKYVKIVSSATESAERVIDFIMKHTPG